MINLIPTAKVIFRDGHEEESISVFPVFENVGTISTISGSYLYDHNNPIKKYHPEYIDTIRYLDGSIEYDDVNCWIVDPLVKTIELSFDPVDMILGGI